MGSFCGLLTLGNAPPSSVFRLAPRVSEQQQEERKKNPAHSCVSCDVASVTLATSEALARASTPRATIMSRNASFDMSNVEAALREVDERTPTATGAATAAATAAEAEALDPKEDEEDEEQDDEAGVIATSNNRRGRGSSRRFGALRIGGQGGG